jgi:phosphatidylserine decarboxylase
MVMRIHREGRVSLLVVGVFILIVNYLVIRITVSPYIVFPLIVASVFLYLFVMYFFRIPNRVSIDDPRAIIAPCDGKVVVVEKKEGNHLMSENHWQVSIFMSPLNVHMNWFPVSGKILHSEITKGNHFVAWAPKSSTHNERSTVKLETNEKNIVVVQQIAGAVARRVVCYATENEYADQNGHLGFIKFGSRVDLLIPNDYEIKVNIDDQTVGSQTVIARLVL